MAFIEKLLVGIATRGANGERVLRPLAASAVKSADDKTLQQHVDDVSIHTSVTVLESTMDSKIGTAINLLKDGDDGTGLATKHDSMAKISADLDGVKNTLVTFLEGEADGGDIDRLIELVNAIANNRDSIDALTADKVEYDDIVDNLESQATDKVLSANQGYVIAGMLDQLEQDLTDTIDGLHTHGNLEILENIGVSAATGGLTYVPYVDGPTIDMGYKWVMHMTEAEADALTEWPADLAPGGIIMLDPNPAP